MARFEATWVDVTVSICMYVCHATLHTDMGARRCPNPGLYLAAVDVALLIGLLGPSSVGGSQHHLRRKHALKGLIHPALHQSNHGKRCPRAWSPRLTGAVHGEVPSARADIHYMYGEELSPLLRHPLEGAGSPGGEDPAVSHGTVSLREE